MHHLNSTPIRAVAISQEERAFFVAFGERMAALRKAQGVTQVQLAETLGVSQQAITAYESGQRRVPISLLPSLANALGTTIEGVIGVDAKRSPAKRGPQPKIAQQLEQIRALPVTKQRMVAQMIDAVLAQAAQ
jgi:transcriptional regulator with XRE-family HTH domain